MGQLHFSHPLITNIYCCKLCDQILLCIYILNISWACIYTFTQGYLQHQCPQNVCSVCPTFKNMLLWWNGLWKYLSYLDPELWLSYDKHIFLHWNGLQIYFAFRVLTYHILYRKITRSENIVEVLIVTNNIIQCFQGPVHISKEGKFPIYGKKWGEIIR